MKCHLLYLYVCLFVNQLAVHRNQTPFPLAILASGIFHPAYLCLRIIEDSVLLVQV